MEIMMAVTMLVKMTIILVVVVMMTIIWLVVVKKIKHIENLTERFPTEDHDSCCDGKN